MTIRMVIKMVIKMAATALLPVPKFQTRVPFMVHPNQPLRGNGIPGNIGQPSQVITLQSHHTKFSHTQLLSHGKPYFIYSFTHFLSPLHLPKKKKKKSQAPYCFVFQTWCTLKVEIFFSHSKPELLEKRILTLFNLLLTYIGIVNERTGLFGLSGLYLFKLSKVKLNNIGLPQQDSCEIFS